MSDTPHKRFMFYALETAFYQFGATKHHYSYPQARPSIANTYLPNEMERDLLWLYAKRKFIGEVWVPPEGQSFDPVHWIEIELDNEATDYPTEQRGGFNCFRSERKDFVWQGHPDLIALEMNRRMLLALEKDPDLFIFHVAESYVREAQISLQI